VNDWRPIATAPRDGTWILAHSKSLRHVIVKYSQRPANHEPHQRTDWRVVWDADYLASEPTHWMPLPPSPEPQH
jgi:hypothetical protein